MRGTDIKTALAALMCTLTIAGAFGCAPSSTVESGPANATDSPLVQAEAAFVGGFSRAQIKESLDKALPLYELALTDENYSRAASTLVVLRKANGIPEMKILDYMIRSHVAGVRLSFPEAAGMAAAFLRSGG